MNKQEDKKGRFLHLTRSATKLMKLCGFGEIHLHDRKCAKDGGGKSPNLNGLEQLHAQPRQAAVGRLARMERMMQKRCRPGCVFKYVQETPTHSSRLSHSSREWGLRWRPRTLAPFANRPTTAIFAAGPAPGAAPSQLTAVLYLIRRALEERGVPTAWSDRGLAGAATGEGVGTLWHAGAAAENP